MNTIKIIMLDSGIGEYQASLCKNIEEEKLSEADVDTIGHGCAVFHILSSAGVPIESRKVMYADEIEEDVLLEELRSLTHRGELENTIINLSLGITFCRKKDELLDICERLMEKGCIIVSAFDNDGAVSYPAAFPCVIGVDTSRSCKKIAEYEYVENSIVNIRGFGGMQVLPNPDGKKEKYIGSSFVAPHITAMIAEMLKTEKLQFNDILTRLKEGAVKVYGGVKQESVVQKIPKINKAIVFPLNKEIMNLLRYPELLSFEIQDVYDFHHMRTIGKSVSKLIGKEVFLDHSVKNVKDINWEADFDSIIMGHMLEINQTLHFDYIKYFLDCARQYGKKVYAFDSLSNYADEVEQLEIVYPQIDKSKVPQNRFGKQYQIHCPIIGVFGTSSKQGKFTLQLELRKRFIRDGFNVAQLSTEPNGLLYGMDAVYPMGYGSNVEIGGYEEISVINDMLNQIVKDDTDILLIGSQSQTVAYSSQNIALYPIGNVNLLLASFPDIVVLCVNYYDDMEYIRRTICYLEGIVDTHVLAFVVSPFMQEYSGSTMVRNAYVIDNEKLSTYKKKLQENFQKEAFLLNQEEEIEELYDLCIKTMT